MNDDREVKPTVKVWPLVDPKDCPGTGSWLVLSAAAALAVAMPFLLIITGLCAGLWLSNVAESVLLDSLGQTWRIAIVFSYTMKFSLLFLAARMIWLIVPYVPSLVVGARRVILEG